MERASLTNNEKCSSSLRSVLVKSDTNSSEV